MGNAMNTTHEHDHKEAPPPPHEPERGNAGSRTKWAFLGFATIAAFFLFSEHRAHFLGILPWLLLLACPLMHLFHHGGHGRGHAGHGGSARDESEGERK